MSQSNLSDITPVFFLQTFILELMHACEQQGQQQTELLIEHIAKTAGCFFEQTYREGNGKTNALDKESYTELILGLKNSIGGKFSLVSSNQDCITLTNSSCPFGDRVTNFPELCRMTSSVFGGIAARNFGYAKIEIKKSIAGNDGCCEVCVHTNREIGNAKPGIEYNDTSQLKENRDIRDLQNKIEQSMHSLWKKQVNRSSKKNLPPMIVAKSPLMQKILKSIEIIAPTTATVLIEGKTGVGKELVARAIHAMSDRCEQPFIPINCGAIPESLIESALFGHEKGAFTGAIEVHQGYFERAEGGTLFLDEINSLSPAAQTRLLRVIQEGEMERVGGKQILPVDLRIISATNQNLEIDVEQGTFRKDLFYRINVVKLSIPSLSERPEDLPSLVHLILQRLNKKYNKNVRSVSRSVMQQIRSYRWPGNVRELENTLERSVLFTDGEELTTLDLGNTQALNNPIQWKDVKEFALTEVEKNYLISALTQYQGDVKKVAEAMDLTTRAIYGKIKKHRLNTSNFREPYQD